MHLHSRLHHGLNKPEPPGLGPRNLGFEPTSPISFRQMSQVWKRASPGRPIRFLDEQDEVFFERISKMPKQHGAWHTARIQLWSNARLQARN